MVKDSAPTRIIVSDVDQPHYIIARRPQLETKELTQGQEGEKREEEYKRGKENPFQSDKGGEMGQVQNGADENSHRGGAFGNGPRR